MSSSTRWLRSTGLIAGLTLCSRLLGFLREYAFSYYFGTSELLSAYRIAFQVPNLARRLFGEGALSSAMVPILTETQAKDGEETARRFCGAVLSGLIVFLGTATIVLELGLAGARLVTDDPAIGLTALTLPYMPLICVAAVAGGILNVRRHFAVPAAAPTLLNLANMAALVGGSVLFGWQGRPLMVALCASVLAAGVLQVGLTAAALGAVRFFPRIGGSWRDDRVRSVLRLMGPMALGLSAVQVNTLVDSLIAYVFVTREGERVGTAILGYAQFLYQLPLGVFGISIATAIFPLLSELASRDDRPGLTAAISRGLRLTTFIAMPCAVGLMFVAKPMVATLYALEPWETSRVAWTLWFYALGIPAYFAQHIVVRAYYALRDSRTPARIAVRMVLLNLAINFMLVFVMEERGLALATAVSAYVQLALLVRGLRKRLGGSPDAELAHGIARTVLCTGVMAAGLALPWIPGIHGPWSGLPAGVQLAIMLAVGVGFYLAATRRLNPAELREVMRAGL